MFGAIPDIKPAATDEDTIPTGSETFDAAWALQWDYNNSLSEATQFNEKHRARLDAIEKRTGGRPQFLDFYPNGTDAAERAEAFRHFIRNQDVLVDEDFNVTPNSVRGQQLVPNPFNVETIKAIAFMDRMVQASGGQIPSDQQIWEVLKSEAAERVPELESIVSRGSGAKGFLGTGAAAIGDPLVLATLPFGASAGAGRSVLAGMTRAAKIEAGIAAGTEVPIQAQAYKFRNQVGYTMTGTEAALNILMVTVGAGALAGGISGGLGLVRKYRKGVEEGRITPTEETEAAASHVEATALASDTVPERLDVETHAERINEAGARAEQGDLLDIDTAQAVEEGITETPAVRGMDQRLQTATADGIVASTGAEIRILDPGEIKVDPKRFQFKDDGDEFGVRDSLREQVEYDEDLAGALLAWESKSGEVFIVDGHQRLGIANRAKAAGQDVNVTVWLMREADGVSVDEAMAKGSFRNATSTSGSALDVARFLRTNQAAKNFPALAAKTVAMRQGRQLSNLGDDAFDLAVNEVIPANHAAIVGERIQGDAEQVAAIEVLQRLKPANEVQARAMVEQMRVAGFETRTTGDLFGEREIAESFIKERAQILDATMKRARADRATFKRLLDRQEDIEATGENVVDTAASGERVSEMQQALQQLSSLANVRGPVSDALTRSARELREGAKLSDLTDRVIESIGDSEVDALGAVRPRAHINGERTSEVLPDFRPQEGLSPEDRAIENEIMDIFESTPMDELKAQYVRFATDPKTGDYKKLPPEIAEKIISADVAREFSPSFRADQGKSAAVHEPASAFTKRLLFDRFAEPVEGDKDLFIHIAGGTGAGKTTGLRQHMNTLRDAHVILDSNLAGAKSAIRKLNKAKESGLRTEIIYVFADPVESGVRAVRRSQRKANDAGIEVGRTVPIDQHAITHARSRAAVIEASQATDTETLVLMNTGAKGDPITVGNLRDVPVVDEANVVKSLVSRVLEELENGNINAGTARGFLDFPAGRKALRESGLGREGLESVDSGIGTRGRSGRQESGPADRPEPVQRVVEREPESGRPDRTDGTGIGESKRKLTDSLETIPRLQEAIKATGSDALGDLEQTVLQALRALEDGDVPIKVVENGQELEVSAREFFDRIGADERALQSIEDCMRARGVA